MGIEAGTNSWEVATTMDIFTTTVTLGGGEIPGDRIIDGKNLDPIFRGAGKSEHEAVYYYAGTPDACGRDSGPCPGLWAIRWKEYKMHWASKDSNSNKVTVYDTPL